MQNGKGSGMGKHADSNKGSKGNAIIPGMCHPQPQHQGGPVPGVPSTQKK